jgi:predicted RNA methylase
MPNLMKAPYASLSIHRWMLRDEVRNEAYRRALAALVEPGQVVLDMGAGTGILSIFAAQAGARKVYAVERTSIATVARQMVIANGFAGRIEVIQGDLEDVDLPEKVDVLTSEWMGGLGVDENMLAPLVMARSRWLKPGGTIVPGRVTAVLAPAWVSEFDEDLHHWRSRPHGVDMSVIADLTANETLMSQHHLTPDDLLAAPQTLWSHDPATCSLEEADRSFEAKRTFTSRHAGKLSGLAAWFTAEMGDGRSLTNAVGEADTHWGRMLFPLGETVEVPEGTRIDVEIHCDPTTPGGSELYWAVQIDGVPVARLRAGSRRAPLAGG